MGLRYLRSQRELRFSSYLCGQLFTWPTDQPRHATNTATYPVETRSPPTRVIILLKGVR